MRHPRLKALAFGAAVLLGAHGLFAAAFCVQLGGLGGLGGLGTPEAAAVQVSAPIPAADATAAGLLNTALRSPWLAIHCGLPPRPAHAGGAAAPVAAHQHISPECVYCVAALARLTVLALPPQLLQLQAQPLPHARTDLAPQYAAAAQPIRGPPAA